MSFMFSFIPLIVGGIFFALGANYVLHFLRFRRNARPVRGRVTAIEKYVSTTRTSEGRRTQVYFRPVVDYVFAGAEHQTVGPGINEVRHRLGQNVTVLVRADDNGNTHQAMLDDNIRVIVGTVFALMGLGALALYVLSAGGSPFVAVGVAGVMFAVGYAITNALANVSMPFVSSADVQPGAGENSTLITTPAHFRQEVSSHAFWGAVIAWGFMLLSLGILYFGLSEMPQDAQDLMASDFGAFMEKIMQGDIKSSWENALILAGAGLFFFLASLRSVYYVHTKYGALLRR